jgi:hypothetical protein
MSEIRVLACVGAVPHAELAQALIAPNRDEQLRGARTGDFGQVRSRRTASAAAGSSGACALGVRGIDLCRAHSERW